MIDLIILALAMFPLQQNDELCFKISSNPTHQQHKIPQDLILSQSHASKDIITNRMETSRRRKLCVMGSTTTDEFCSDNNNSKKMMHRDIERQRRQEMATLYTSLRSLLPLEFIKGKRSISDHMNEAVNYIKHLQKNIKELGDKRDKLKSLSDSSALGSATGSTSNSNSLANCVVISPSLVGVEIVFSCGFGAEGLCLSKVLEAVLEEGLSVINCVSTKVDDRLLHTIQTEINDPSCFNLSLLQQKLTQME